HLARPAKTIGSFAMTLHPLTPRKARLPAAAASALAFVAVLALGIAIHFVAFPPVAWLPAADEARSADLPFLFLMFDRLLGDAVSGLDLSSRIDGLLALPFAVVNALRYLDLHVSLAIRAAAIVMASMIAGMTAHKLVLDRTTAQTSVQHIKGPRLLSGREAKSALLAAWHRRYGATERGIALAKGVSMPRQLET